MDAYVGLFENLPAQMGIAQRVIARRNWYRVYRYD